MAAISQVDPAGTTGLRGLSPTAAPVVLPSEEQDVFSRGTNVDRANQRDGATPANSGEASPDGTVQNGEQVNGAPDVNQLNAADQAAGNTNEQAQLRSNQASQDQQLPTPVDPSRGTQLDIAV